MSSTPANETPVQGHLHKLRVLAVRAGNSVVQSIAAAAATSTLTRGVLTSSLMAETRLATSAAIASTAQLEGCAAVALRVPLTAESKEQLACVIQNYVASNPEVLNRLSQMSPVEQVVIAGLEGTVVSAIISLAVQQALMSCLWLRSGGSAEEWKQNSKAATASAAGCVTGSVAGAAVGTVFFPGVGTSVGSLVGGLVGSHATAYVVPYYDPKATDKPWNPSRLLTVVDVEDEGDWLEIRDATTATRFQQDYVMIGDELSSKLHRLSTTAKGPSAVGQPSSQQQIERERPAPSDTEASIPLLPQPTHDGGSGDSDLVIYFSIDDSVA